MSNSPGVNFHPGLTGLKNRLSFSKARHAQTICAGDSDRYHPCCSLRSGRKRVSAAGMELSKKTGFFSIRGSNHIRNPWLIALRYHPKRFDLKWICRECRGSHPPHPNWMKDDEGIWRAWKNRSFLSVLINPDYKTWQLRILYWLLVGMSGMLMGHQCNSNDLFQNFQRLEKHGLATGKSSGRNRRFTREIQWGSGSFSFIFHVFHPTLWLC